MCGKETATEAEREAGKGIKRSRSGILRTGGHVEGLEAIMIRDDERICERRQRGDRREREGCALKRRQLPRLSFRDANSTPFDPAAASIVLRNRKKIDFENIRGETIQLEGNVTRIRRSRLPWKCNQVERE